jgi:AraC-like DNA-binding protein
MEWHGCNRDDVRAGLGDGAGDNRCRPGAGATAEAGDEVDGIEAGDQRVDVGLGGARRRTTDARIDRVVREIERRPDAFSRLQDAAALACLSPSRFRARFDAELGLPFRRYRLWRRMAAVMREIAAGGNLTEAALSAGFSSSAHLSSAFRQMFGLAPSALLTLGVEIDLSGDRLARA